MSSVALSLPTPYVRTPYRDLLLKAGVPDITLAAEKHRAKMLAAGRGAWKNFGGLLTVCRVGLDAVCFAFFISVALACATFLIGAWKFAIGGFVLGTAAKAAFGLSGWLLLAGAIAFVVLFTVFHFPGFLNALTTRWMSEPYGRLNRNEVPLHLRQRIEQAELLGGRAYIERFDTDPLVYVQEDGRGPRIYIGAWCTGDRSLDNA